MNDKDFCESIQAIIAEGFTPEGLQLEPSLLTH